MLMIIVLSIGITHVFARGTIFRRVRALWPALLDCPLCSGVWIAYLVQLGLAFLPSVTIALGLACVAATLSLAVYGLIRAIPVRQSVGISGKTLELLECARKSEKKLLSMQHDLHDAVSSAGLPFERDGRGEGFW